MTLIDAYPLLSTGSGRCAKTSAPLPWLLSPAAAILVSEPEIWWHLASMIYVKPCRNALEQRPADLIHVMTPNPGAAVMIRAGHAAGIPVLYQELGNHHLPALAIHYEQLARVLPLCSQVAALSPQLAQQWEARFPTSKPISVLPLLVQDAHEAHLVRARRPGIRPASHSVLPHASSAAKGQ